MIAAKRWWRHGWLHTRSDGTPMPLPRQEGTEAAEPIRQGVLAGLG